MKFKQGQLATLNYMWVQWHYPWRLSFLIKHPPTILLLTNLIAGPSVSSMSEWFLPCLIYNQNGSLEHIFTAKNYYKALITINNKIQIKFVDPDILLPMKLKREV